MPGRGERPFGEGLQEPWGEAFGAEEGHRHPLAAERIDRPLAIAGEGDPREPRGADLHADPGDGLPLPGPCRGAPEPGERRVPGELVVGETFEIAAIG